MKKSEFATLISVTPRRLGQLIGEGSIVFKGKGRRRGVDPIPSLVKLLEQAKTANANRDARAQLTHAQIRQQQLRAERQLKHWLSIDEVEMLVAPIYAHGCEAAQRESQQLYDKLAGKLSLANRRSSARTRAKRFSARFAAGISVCKSSSATFAAACSTSAAGSISISRD